MFFGAAYPLKLKWLRVRHGYKTRWAHKPLCTRFRSDALKVGNVYLCRSCTAVYFGVALGAASVLLTPAMRSHVTPIFLGLLATTLTLSWPQFYKTLPRTVRDFARLSLGSCFPLGVSVALFANVAVAAAAAALTATAWGYFFRKRKARKASECNGCAELNEPKICSGFELQAEGSRQFETAATNLYIRSKQSPFG